MRRALKVILYGVVGLTVTAGLTLGAYAMAGKRLSEPAAPVRLERAPAAALASPTQAERSPKPHRSPKPEHTDSPSSSPSVDDSGGSPSSGSGSSGSDDHGGDD